MRWVSENGINILSGKDALIITSVGGREANYTKEGKYETEVEELLSGLKVSLKVNNIDLKKIHIIYNADSLNDEQLNVLSDDLSQTLKIK